MTTRLKNYFRKLWRKATHKHEWLRSNSASLADVPDSYPPTHVNYISPRRQCRTCGREEMFVGPEVCGGNQARWVESLRTPKNPNGPFR